MKVVFSKVIFSNTKTPRTRTHILTDFTAKVYNFQVLNHGIGENNIFAQKRNHHRFGLNLCNGVTHQETNILLSLTYSIIRQIESSVTRHVREVHQSELRWYVPDVRSCMCVCV